jgi:ATP-dependent Clp protease ATP-binding subunit ClpA
MTVWLKMDLPTIQIRNTITSQWMTGHGFTNSARRFIHDSESRAHDRGIFGSLPPLLVLWTMLRWERKSGVAVLEESGGDIALLERDVEIELQSFPKGTRRNGIDLVHLKAIAKQAVEEAALLGHKYVGSEHLVLALCRCEDAAVRRVFSKHGLSPEKYSAILQNVSGTRSREID